ncbi:MAG: peptidase [Pseudomonadales bacterium]|nr:peptidase [Pseudomonadales bacterium]
MTYCLAISLDAGLCFLSDSRTNAGMDKVSTYSKMHSFGVDGERQIVILSAGNLATSQGVIGQVNKTLKQNAEENLYSMQHMADAAEYLGQINRNQQEKHKTDESTFEASFIIGGQIRGQKPAVYQVYSEGNYITTSQDTPYLQIGESKYGKPILDRILSPDSSLETAALCGLVSMDSTMRSNLTVGPPIEVVVYEKDSFVISRRYRFEESSEYLRQLKKSWDAKLKDAFNTLPPIEWSANWDRSREESG